MSKSKGPSASLLGARGPRAHRAREYMNTLVDTRERLDSALETLRGVSKKGPNLAVDGEGDNYTRRGTMSLFAIATRNHVFLFDIIKLGKLTFDRGLREILEDPTRKKLMFDCREDSDILWHQFHVKLDGVLDLQLLQVMHSKRDISDLSPIGRRRGEIAFCPKVFGLMHCLEVYTNDFASIQTKKSIGSTYAQSTEQWLVRPLPSDMIKYACVDVSTLFVLYEKMKMGDLDMELLNVASERYVDLKRSIIARRYDSYENNGYLPLYIIPPKGADKGIVHSYFLYKLLPNIGPECTGCQRRFPQEAFIGTDLSKGEQKCKVCLRVKMEKSAGKIRGRRL